MGFPVKARWEKLATKGALLSDNIHRREILFMSDELPH
jgi:hypothetical protein